MINKQVNVKMLLANFFLQIKHVISENHCNLQPVSNFFFSYGYLKTVCICFLLCWCPSEVFVTSANMTWSDEIPSLPLICVSIPVYYTK